MTCLYTGEPAPDGHKLWSALAAMGTSYTFLPSAVLAASLGLAAPCFGSTIALGAETLDEVGGVAAFADQLADDYEIGRAVRSQGLYCWPFPPLACWQPPPRTPPGTFPPRAALDPHHPARWSIPPAIWAASSPMDSPSRLTAAPLAAGLQSCSAWAFWPRHLASRLFLKWRIDGLFGTYAGPYLADAGAGLAEFCAISWLRCAAKPCIGVGLTLG